MILDSRQLFKKKEHYYLIGVYSQQDSYVYNVILVELVSNELKVTTRFSFEDLEDGIKSNLKRDYPILLYFDGDNVISRSIEKTDSYRNTIVFNASLDDFYFYEYHQNGTVFTSVIRKQIIEDVISKLNKAEKFVSNVALGPFVISQFLKYNKVEDVTYTKFHKITSGNGIILSFEKTEARNELYNFSDERLNQSEIGLIATFLSYKTKDEKIVFDDTFLQHNQLQNDYRKRFKQISVFTIVTVLLVLFVGHFLLNHYLEALAEKESQYSISQQTLMQLDGLKQEQILKEKVLNASGVIDARFVTNYFVDIGNNVPENVTLLSIDIAPTQKKINLNEKISLKKNNINLTGESTSDQSFNQFIKNLETIEWIKKIDIEDYREEKNSNQFLIRITK
jgi:Tfp pilus assembly protein PilN